MYRFLSVSIFCLLGALGCDGNFQPPKDDNTTRADLAIPNWYDDSSIDTLRILSWNTEHFVDNYDNPYINNRREDRPASNMEHRREMLADVLKRANADIVVLQEFESSSYAQQLSQQYFPELGYQVFGGTESDDWYMNVVIMSRVPLGTFYSYAASNTPIIDHINDEGLPDNQTFLNNRMWSVDVIVNEKYDFNLTGVHLKAGRGDENKQWRRGMLKLLRNQFGKFMRLDPDQNLLIVGDFNSTPESPEFKEFLGADSELEFIDPLAGTGVFTHPADSVFWRIDHIIPNTFMLPEIIPGSVGTFQPLVPDSMNLIADHLPLMAWIIPREQ